MSDSLPVSLSINGENRNAFVQPWHTLLHVLRDVFHLTGSKRGCNQGSAARALCWSMARWCAVVSPWR